MLAHLLLALACPGAPDPGEGEQRALLAEREPVRRLWQAIGIFAKAGRRGEAALSRLQPRPPVWRSDVAHIGHRARRRIGRRRKAPAHHRQLPADGGFAHHRRHHVRKNRREGRQVADAIPARGEQSAHRLLAFGHRIEIAHRATLGAAPCARKPFPAVSFSPHAVAASATLLIFRLRSAKARRRAGEIIDNHNYRVYISNLSTLSCTAGTPASRRNRGIDEPPVVHASGSRLDRSNSPRISRRALGARAG